MKILLSLFWTFFKLGAFTFGGGYAMISLIENEVVSKKGWLTRDEMLDIITIAESTPGPLAVNMATFVGTKIKGFLGALIATLGLIIPPFVIIICITLVLNEFKQIELVAYALQGIQAGVVVLIFNAFLKFFKGMDKSVISFIFLTAAFLVAFFTDFSVVLIILIGAVLGVSISFISSAIAKKKLAKSTSQNVDTSNGVSTNNDIQDLDRTEDNIGLDDANIDSANNDEIDSDTSVETIDDTSISESSSNADSDDSVIDDKDNGDNMVTLRDGKEGGEL